MRSLDRFEPQTELTDHGEYRRAGKRGVGYQTVIKTLLHEALKKESKNA